MMDLESIEKRNKTILVVEDDEELLNLITDKLNKCGFQPKPFLSAQSAWDLITKEKVDLIILDLVLPEKDGLWFLDQLRADPELTKIPVIVFTNLSEGVKVAEAVAKGVHRLLVKSSTTLEQLVLVIEEIYRILEFEKTKQ